MVPAVDNSRIRTAFIKDMIGKFLDSRYDEMFLYDIGNFRYEVVVEYDQIRLAYQVRIRTGTGHEMALLAVDSNFFDHHSGHSLESDWGEWQKCRMEPLMDTLMFVEWFNAILPEEDRAAFKRVAHIITRVTYRRPHGVMLQEVRGGVQAVDPASHLSCSTTHPVSAPSNRVDPNWLAIVRFAGGGDKRLLLREFRDDAVTWLSMMLMAVDTNTLMRGLRG